jgi:hypothetical protein
MKEKNRLVKVYAGTEIYVISLKDKLEKSGISAIIQNDSANSFLRGVPVAIDLYIQQSDFKKAEPIISEFLQKNKVYPD